MDVIDKLYNKAMKNEVLFGSYLDCLVTILFEMVRHVFLSSVCPTAVPANFTSEWEISRLRHYVVGVTVRVGPALGC